MKSTRSFANKILTCLSPKEDRNILAQLRSVRLLKGQVLSEQGAPARQIYFPEEALISCLSGTSEGESVEICTVGNEGVVDLSTLFSIRTAFRAVVQIPGSACVMSTEALRREFQRCSTIHRALMDYMQGYVVQLAQTAVCSRFHSVDERFCRWLLGAHDRRKEDSIPMTQDAMARILGNRRASISGVAATLQEKGIIRYTRGTISILDRVSLESECCECYETIKAAQN